MSIPSGSTSRCGGVIASRRRASQTSGGSRGLSSASCRLW
jgi:hypothetical protein